VDGRTLIFLHGGNHGSWCWAPLLAALASRTDARTVLLDMPGCGTKRGRSAAGMTLADIVTELNGELRAAGVSGGVLIGHSIAGALMPMLIAEDPALYASAVFLATCAPLEGQTVAAMMGGGRHGSDPEAIGFPLDPATAAPTDQLKAMFCDDMGEDVIEWLLSEIALDTTPEALMTQPISRVGYAGLVPATYILTLRDGILPVVWQRRFAERLGCGRVVEIDTPHEPFISHPTHLADTLSALI
jgi:pimeloyl-ACP methyl ester carboxylesterase